MKGMAVGEDETDGAGIFPETRAMASSPLAAVPETW